MPPAFYLREFREEDLPSLYGLIQHTIDIAYAEVYPPESVAFFKEYHSENNILNDAANGYTVVAKLRGEMLGTGTLVDTNIRRVFTGPQNQRQGIGKAIVREMESQARLNQASNLYLEASLVSQQFWEALGYVINREDFILVGQGQQLRYYRMSKRLNSQQASL